MDTALRRQKRQGGVPARSREHLLEAGREFVRLYGESELTAAAFAPAAAKRAGRPDAVERYYKGRPNPDGTWPQEMDPPRDANPWPSLNALRRAFHGSFNEYRKALGLPLNSTGPSQGRPRRLPGEADPILNVRERRVVVDGEGTAWLRKQLAAAERRAARAEERLEAAKREVVEASVDPREVANLRARLQDERSRRKTIQRELTNAERREARVRVREESLRTVARGDVELLREVDRLTARLARAESRTSQKAKPKVVTKTKTRTRTVEVRDDRSLRRADRAEARVGELRVALARSEEVRTDLADRLATIRREVMAEALRTERVRRAEARVKELERRLAEQTELLVGERRVLSEDEVAKLRTDGPAGHAVFVAAVKRISRAEGSIARRAAIHDAISALVNWSDRL